jgi:hypothetical protein
VLGLGEGMVLTSELNLGSMTGAPKLRSVKLLEGFEDYQPRGVYSGTFQSNPSHFPRRSSKESRGRRSMIILSPIGSKTN